MPDEDASVEMQPAVSRISEEHEIILFTRRLLSVAGWVTLQLVTQLRGK
jgi:hypothetical protein